MSYRVEKADISTFDADTWVVALSENTPLKATDALNERLGGLIAAQQEAGNLSAKAGEVRTLYTTDPTIKRVIVVGAGELPQTPDGCRKMLAAASGKLALEKAARHAAVALAEVCTENRDAAWQASQWVTALEASRYRFDHFKSQKEEARELDCTLILTENEADAVSEAVVQAEAVARGMALTRDLANTPGNICNPIYLAEQAQDMARTYSTLKTQILDQDEMEALGMGALLAVARGSVNPPRLIVMTYTGPGAEGQSPDIIVGKGITFDSGGISLKPGEAMDEMKYDMGGAASVFGTLKALCEMNAPVHVVGIIAAAENMPDGNATRPGDIVTTLSGQTVEILNTDAEGRLVLCDALTYAQQLKPRSIVDIATLTGACIIALGHVATGILANDDTLAAELLEAARTTGDKAWQLPLWDEYDEQLKSPFADMANIGGRPAGTITAACFLSRFTREVKWAHLDIAGTAWVSGKDKGATGRPVPLLTRWLLNRAQS
ncbi:MAG: leucyl aminopeptidase [Gammaproteobacteria bacterium]|nr:MAG: leucyl aminopeptidase [Gammaproteobacteria bacterium]